MTKPRILVTGSTGKTGTPVVELLLARGYPVCALAHQVDDRSQHLAVLGAEVVGDFRDLPSLRAAMQGVKRVYFCYPPQGDRLLEAATCPPTVQPPRRSAYTASSFAIMPTAWTNATGSYRLAPRAGRCYNPR